ncbi:hypothetical protein GQ457_09G015300 [Hibiscus cannabinus]
MDSTSGSDTTMRTDDTSRGVAEKQYDDPSRDPFTKIQIREEEMRKTYIDFLDKPQKLATQTAQLPLFLCADFPCSGKGLSDFSLVREGVSEFSCSLVYSGELRRGRDNIFV